MDGDVWDIGLLLQSSRWSAYSVSGKSPYVDQLLPAWALRSGCSSRIGRLWWRIEQKSIPGCAFATDWIKKARVWSVGNNQSTLDSLLDINSTKSNTSIVMRVINQQLTVFIASSELKFCSNENLNRTISPLTPFWSFRQGVVSL